jgi:hypothetical protein
MANRNKFKYMIKWNAKGKIMWDTLIIVIAIFNSIFVPINFAFDPPFSNTAVYIAFNDGIITAIFFLDVFINFRTSLMNFRTGEEIVDPKKIAKLYILSARFWVDILSSIPFDSFSNADILSVIGLLKTVRLARISTIIENSNMNERIKTVSYINIIIRLFNLFIYRL